MTLSSVVLPEPEGPRRATTSPGATSREMSSQRIDARLALAKVLGDASQADECALDAGLSPCSAPQRGGRVGLERGPHAKGAGQQADEDDNASERQHVVRLQHDAAREVVLDVGDEQGAEHEAGQPSASACCTIMPTMVRSGAPISFSMAIWRSFSMVMV